MDAMDTTRIEELLSKLEAADPAEAPDIADELTAALAAALDGPVTEQVEPQAQVPGDTEGGAP